MLASIPATSPLCQIQLLLGGMPGHIIITQDGHLNFWLSLPMEAVYISIDVALSGK